MENKKENKPYYFSKKIEKDNEQFKKNLSNIGKLILELNNIKI